jgi:hypothetical protein
MQGKPDYYKTDNARGHVSPIGGARPDPFATIHRDEDIASAPMTRHGRKGAPTNRRGFITPIKGRFPTAGDAGAT